ncbi:MAG: response regulator transcription factor [Oscillospiraceae bacterium]|jgi:DNA-binding LytR/AlgR family response regulator|nr:response regulator transcription factor [Oscillospiraceae bacterium]
MKIAVCDDNQLCRDTASELLQHYAAEHPDAEITIFSYEHADDLMDAARKTGGFDIYILDIIMPDTNGVKLGVLLRENGYDGKIIYLTSSAEYAIESFQAQPLQYIIKPVTKEKLFPVLDTAVSAASCRKEKSIIVKTSDGRIRLPIESIMYAELQRNKISYYLVSGKCVQSTTIRISFADAVQELSCDDCFVRCGASLIVNLLHVAAAKTDELRFRDGTTLFLSSKLLTDIRKKWYDYWLDDGEEKL